MAESSCGSAGASSLLVSLVASTSASPIGAGAFACIVAVLTRGVSGSARNEFTGPGVPVFFGLAVETLFFVTDATSSLVTALTGPRPIQLRAPLNADASVWTAVLGVVPDTGLIDRATSYLDIAI